MTHTFILVHGFWLGSWAWDEVRVALEAAGHSVIAPTLPGNEPHADRADIGLEDHVRAIVEVIDATDGPLVLVGHSAGGAVVHAAVDRRPDRVAHSVYLDTRPVADGLPLNAELAGDHDEVPRRAWEEFAPGWLDGLDDDALERFDELSTPSPAGAARDPQRLTDARRYDVPVTMVPSTYTEDEMRELARTDPRYQEVARFRDLRYIPLPTGHYPMLSRPADLAALLAGIVA